MLAWGKVERSHLVNGVSMLETTQVEPESACPIRRMQTQSTADPMTPQLLATASRDSFILRGPCTRAIAHARTLHRQ